MQHHKGWWIWVEFLFISFCLGWTTKEVNHSWKGWQLPVVCCAQVKKKILEVALSLTGADEEDIEVAGGMAGRWHGMKETCRISEIGVAYCCVHVLNLEFRTKSKPLLFRDAATWVYEACCIWEFSVSRFDFPFPSLKGNFAQREADTPLMEAGLTSTMAVGPGSSAKIWGWFCHEHQSKKELEKKQET